MYARLFELQATILQALAHPKRLEIIYLLRGQELCVTDIYSMLDLPQAGVSQQLMILRDAGVVTTRKQGKQTFYSLTKPQLVQACDLVRQLSIEQLAASEAIPELTWQLKDLVPLAHDPVCQMRLSPRTAAFSQSFAGQEYYFCASGCQKKFLERPESYVD